jgi:hypothetical protein
MTEPKINKCTITVEALQTMSGHDIRRALRDAGMSTSDYPKDRSTFLLPIWTGLNGNVRLDRTAGSLTFTQEPLMSNECDDREADDQPEKEQPIISRLRHALGESVKLQSHYAGLLNYYDGGKRMQFADVDAWMARLNELAAGEG